MAAAARLHFDVEVQASLNLRGGVCLPRRNLIIAARTQGFAVMGRIHLLAMGRIHLLART